MTLAQLYQALKSIGIPVAYRKFKEPKPLPFIIYMVTGKKNKKADNCNYWGVKLVDIELYSEQKDETLEELLESKLRELNLPCDPDEDEIESDDMIVMTYSVELS